MRIRYYCVVSVVNATRVATQGDAIDGLHDGECAAIALAMELGADRLIIDEALGRKIAAEKGIKIVGTVGVLETAAARGLIELEAAFQMLSQTDFWLPEGFLSSRLEVFRKKYPYKK